MRSASVELTLVSPTQTTAAPPLAAPSILRYALGAASGCWTTAPKTIGAHMMWFFTKWPLTYQGWNRYRYCMKVGSFAGVNAL